MSSVIQPHHVLSTQYDKRSSWVKKQDRLLSIFRELRYGCSFVYHYLFSAKYHHCGEKRVWNKESKSLCVLVHGLRSHPCIWRPQLELLKRHPEIDLFVPFVPKKGNCSLEEAAVPILPTILDYAEQHPGKPICLMGVSNGSRIVTWLETQLREKAPRSAVRVSTIAGIHFGSPVVNWLEKYKLAFLILKPVIRKELAFGSQKAKDLMEKVTKPLPPNTAPRSWDFSATTEDLQVPHLGTSLPNLPGATRHIRHGHGHSSIVEAMAEEQIRSYVKWMGHFLG